MKGPAIVALGILSCRVLADVRMSVTIGGHKVGTATITQEIARTGVKIVHLSMTIGSGDDQVTVSSDSTYDPTGAPMRMYEQTWKVKDKVRRTVIVNFDDKGAEAQIDMNGQHSTKRIPVPGSGSRTDPSEFWFIKKHPPVAAAVTAYRFSIDSLSWSLITTTYKGMRPVVIDGERVTAHVTDSERGTAYLDDKGLPLRLEVGDAELERIWKKS